MGGLKYKDIKGKGHEVLDMTSLTEAEFESLVAKFERKYQEYMQEWCLDGKKRTQRSYSTYANCPLPSGEERLLFILTYLKNNPLQQLHGRLFGLPQCKANQWIRVLLQVLHQTLQALELTPARSLKALAQRLGCSTEQRLPTSEGEIAPSPLFAMMAPKEKSRVPQVRLNKKVLIAARQKRIPSKTSY